MIMQYHQGGILIFKKTTREVDQVLGSLTSSFILPYVYLETYVLTEKVFANPIFLEQCRYTTSKPLQLQKLKINPGYHQNLVLVSATEWICKWIRSKNNIVSNCLHIKQEMQKNANVVVNAQRDYITTFLNCELL